MTNPYYSGRRLDQVLTTSQVLLPGEQEGSSSEASELISFPISTPLWAKTAEVVPDEEPRTRVTPHLDLPTRQPHYK